MLASGGAESLEQLAKLGVLLQEPPEAVAASGLEKFLGDVLPTP
jgi:hypothetical protein